MPKVTNISSLAAEDLKSLPNNTVLISINNEHEPLFPLKLDRQDSRILTLQFTDITAPITRGKDIFNPISSDQALAINDFIERNLGKDIIVACAAGISRSGAVAVYLHIMYQYELKSRFWQTSHPNFYVLGRLFVNKYQK